MFSTQQKRLIWQSSFFVLFLFAPILDIFRFDLNENHLVLFGQPWLLGIDTSKEASEMLWNMFTHFFLPLGFLVVMGIYISWKWGRLYCGWLCPHFSVVEIINALMRRASGKLSIWSKETLPEKQQDGTQIKAHKAWWIVTLFVVLFFSFLWAVVLLTYLLPPKEIYSNLFNGELTQNQFVFIAAATVLLTIEFTVARHLFCRFGCAIGLFQSLVWVANKKAMVIGFDRKRAKACGDCDQSCEHACPMRLKPRSFKRNMFTCTQCSQCIQACDNVQAKKSDISLLKMLDGQCALDVSGRGLGNKPKIPKECFDKQNK